MTFDAKDWASTSGRYSSSAAELTRMGQGIQEAQSDLAILLANLGYMDNAVESFTRGVDTFYSPASGRIEVSYVTAYRTQAITQLGAATRQTASTATTGVRRGLYTVAANGDLTLVARTALLVAGYAAQWTEYVSPLDTTGGFPASYTMVKGQRYAFGHFMTYTGTAPAMRGYATNAPSSLLNRPPKMAGTVTGVQTDLLPTITSAQVGTAGNALYQYGLA